MSERLWEVIPRSWEHEKYDEQPPDTAYGIPQSTPRRFMTPSDLWDAAVKYFEWATMNPLKAQHATKMKVGDGMEEIEYYNLSKKRYMSKTSLCLFLGIDRRNYARSYESGKYGQAYKTVCETIDAIILDDKMSGAAAGLYNASIVARDIGLSDGKEDDENDKKATSFEINFNVREPVEVKEVDS